MAGITMCGNDKCELKDGCLRYIAVPDEFNQSYLYDSVINCENKSRKLFIDYLGECDV